MKLGATISALALTFSLVAAPVQANVRADVFNEMTRDQQFEIMLNNVNAINSMALQNGREDISACIRDLFDVNQNPDVPGFGLFSHDLITVRALARDNPEILDQMPVERILFRIVERECIEQDTAGTEAQPAPAPAG